MLLCEMEIFGNHSDPPKRRSRRKKGDTDTLRMGSLKREIDSVFCPECQATDLNIKGDGLEAATFDPDVEIFKFKIRLGTGRRGWMKSPEVLENCSAGFIFLTTASPVVFRYLDCCLFEVCCNELMRSQHRPFAEPCTRCVQTIRKLKLVNFYRAVED